MITKVQKWGNSQGIRLSKEILSDAGIDVGDSLDIRVEDGTLVLVPLRRVRGRVDLVELVREIPADYVAGEYDWGPANGREVW